MGYHHAGFQVVGLDIEPQPHYPFEFHLGDMLTCSLDGFDAYHASPPCGAHSLASQQWRKAGKVYPSLIEPMRERLRATGKPWVIENVVGAPLVNPTLLNGAFFGLNLRRRRLFETSFPVALPLLPVEGRTGFRMRSAPRSEQDPVVPVGHFPGVEKARQMMGCPWMTQKELAQAIPPVYTEYIGRCLRQYIEADAAMIVEGVRDAP